MANAMNMNELIGTSYYFLKQYFGKDVINTNYNDFLLDGLREKINKEKQETGAIIEEKVEEITGAQTVGTMVLENKKGDELARMNLTELPTLFSNMTTSSVGLEMVPGKVVENVDMKAKEELKMKTRIVEEKKLLVDQTKQKVVDLTNKLDSISNPEEKEKIEKELQETQTAEQIAVLEEQKAKSILEEESNKTAPQTTITTITSGLNLFAPTPAPEPGPPAPPAPPGPPGPEQEEKPKEPQRDDAVVKEQLEKAVEENKKEKENQEREHQYKLDQIKQRLAIAAGNKNVADRQLKEAQDKYNNSGGIFGFGNKDEKLKKIVEEKEKEKEKAYEEHKIWLVKYNEATIKDRERKKKEKEAAEKRKLYDEIANRIKQGSIKELYQIEKEAKIQLPTIMEGDENEETKDTKETKETKDKLVAILEEDENENEEDDLARQKALAEYLVANVSRSGIESIRNKLVNIEKNTITDLTQTKNQLEMIQKKRKEFDLSNLDSIDKINSLRQKNNALKTSLDTIHEDIELKTEEYVKVLLETQATENKEIKNDTIKTLTDEIYQIYDSETLENMNVDLILKSKEGELKKKEEEDRKQKEEEEANKKLSEQQKAKQMEEVETVIGGSLAKIQQTKQTINDAIDRIQQIESGKISIPKSNNDSFINFLNKQISTIETSVKELEGLYEPIRTVLNKNNLSQSEEIKRNHPDIFDIDVVIQKGKDTLQLAKDHLKAEQEKREKLKALKPEITQLSEETKTATTQIRDLGITLADKDTSREEAEQIFETIKTLYKTIKIKNDTLQSKIGIQENEVIKQLIETMDVRFETVQGLMEERKEKDNKQPSGKVEVNRPNINTSRSKIGWENTDANEEIPAAQTIIPPEPLFTKNNTKKNRIRLTVPSNELKMEDLEGDGLANVGRPLQPNNVSTEEDYDKTYKELQEETKKNELNKPPQLTKTETPRKNPIQNPIKTAKNILLNKNNPNSKFKFGENNIYSRMIDGGKKTTKRRPTKNKTKKRHT